MEGSIDEREDRRGWIVKGGWVSRMEGWMRVR